MGKLAEPSSGAVKEITKMVEESIKNIQQGNNMAEMTASSAEELAATVGGLQKIIGIFILIEESS